MESDANEQAVVVIAIPEDVNWAFSKRDKQILHKAKRFAESQGSTGTTSRSTRSSTSLRRQMPRVGSGKMKSDEKRIWRNKPHPWAGSIRSNVEDATHEHLTDQERFDRSYAFAACHLAKELHTAAVITHEKLGIFYTARGLIGTGIAGGPDDIRRVVELLEERGIRLKGEHVALVVGMFDGQVRVTNTAQIRIEQKLADLAYQSMRDRSGTLSVQVLRRATDNAGIAFSAEQRAVIHALEGGALTILTGVAGAGKRRCCSPWWTPGTRTRGSVPKAAR